MRGKNSSFVYMYAAVCSDQSIYRHVRTSFSQYKKTIQASKCILNFKTFRILLQHLHSCSFWIHVGTAPLVSPSPSKVYKKNKHHYYPLLNNRYWRAGLEWPPTTIATCCLHFLFPGPCWIPVSHHCWCSWSLDLSFQENFPPVSEGGPEEMDWLDW